MPRFLLFVFMIVGFVLMVQYHTPYNPVDYLHYGE